MDSRRWQSPAAAAAAAEAAEEDTGGAGGPSRRPARRGIHRASPYAGGPRRWLPRIPVASRIFPTIPRDRASSGDSPHCPLVVPRLSADRCSPVCLSESKVGEICGVFLTYFASEFVAIGGMGSPCLAFISEICAVRRSYHPRSACTNAPI